MDPNDARNHPPEDADENQDQLLDEQDVARMEGEDHDSHQEPSADRTDWKAKAIEAEARLRYMQEQQQQQPPAEPVVDDVTRIQGEIEELEAVLQEQPTEKNFWPQQEAQKKYMRLNRQLTAAIDARYQQQLAQQQSQSTVQRFKARFANDPEFQQIEQRFDQWVAELEPQLQQHEGMLEMVRRTIAYEELKKGNQMQQRPGRRVPQSPSNDHAPNVAAQQRRQQKEAQFQDERHQRVAEFYGMDANEYYASQYNDIGPLTEGNGIQIMDVPASGRRGNRRS